MKTRIGTAWIVALAVVATLAVAAERVRYEAAQGSYVKVSGTSTVHDWHVEAKAIEGWIDVAPTELAGGQITSAPMKVSIKANDLKSGKGNMDSVMYKALKTDKNPVVTYEMTSSALMANSDIAKGKLNFQTKGRLTIAGTSKEIAMPVTLQLKGNAVEISGKTPLQMTNFGMKPPTAMLGTIKSGNDVTVEFRWIVKQKK
jgi:polyisoprenoid-binding protein YceI